MPLRPFKFAMLADIHYGTDKLHDGRIKTLSSRALSLTRYLVTRMNNELRPSFVVQLGDLIESDDAEVDEENFDTMLEALKPLSMPVYHVVGNHEQANLDVKVICSMLKYPKLYYSFDSGDFHFVVLFVASKSPDDIHVDAAQRKWLAEDLSKTAKPTVVFVHYPIDEPDLTDSFWLDRNPNQCFVTERADIRDTLSASGKVIAVFNGHLHRNNLLSHGGINYVSLQSLVENMSAKGKTASETFAVVTLTDKEIRVEIEGLDPAEYRITTAKK
ncbi:MAG: metallophosphoesterase [Candidatus Obscuribacterales bacterium]|nr:metallophosphoesterase [Candidatus Obscuribacterales bacterium]